MYEVGFNPIIDDGSEILILGTFPGKRSLEKSQYYAHNGNQFWKIISEVCGAEKPEEYRDRISLLLNNKFGLWDVYYRAVRVGSADSNIKEAEVNDFRSLFQKYPKIKGILFSSKRAEIVFAGSYPDLFMKMPHMTAFSPSSAYPRKLMDKVENWKECIRQLKERILFI